jgi:putative ABC transport system permease protein
MTAWQYILASLRQYRRVHVAVAAGVAVTTAVITGALLVGDSMRGSLRDLALRSLGRVDAALMAEHPFRAALAEELLAHDAVKDHYADAIALLVTRGAATHQDDAGEVRRATALEVFGVSREFWSLASSTDAAAPPLKRGNEIALTAAVARELDAKVGDFVVLRLPLSSATPADSAIGEKEETSASRRLKVAAILDETSRDPMARFSLRPRQQAPRNAFVPLETLQDLLELPGKANAIVLATEANEHETPRPAAALSAVGLALRPELADFGLAVESVDSKAQQAPAYIRISADRLVVPPHVVETAERLFGESGMQPVVTYLANTIGAGDRKVPYSTLAGVDSTAALGPVLDDAETPIRLNDDEVALNDWTARELNVKVGDTIAVRYYEPETTHGELREAPLVSLTVRAILRLATPDGNPTPAADPKFAPDLPGVTDQASIEAWELPFELVEEVRDEDEAYWDEHRTTPKAFVSHSLGKKLWATRWGTDSVLRLPADGERTVESVEAALRDNVVPAELGMALLPAKRQALAAASGTTPFDGLFLGFSFFLMASAMMLTALLFRLGVEQRAREVGLLLATGASAARVRRLFAGESLIVAAVGAAVGGVAGVAYAAFMVHGLNTWWVDATAAPFLELHVTPRSIAIGLAAGLTVAMVTIWRSLRRFATLAPRQLLAGDHQPRLTFNRAGRWSRRVVPLGCLVAAVALGAAALRWQGEAQAGAFFGGGALALIGILAAIRGKLREPATRPPQSFSLSGLAARNARRNPSRTMTSLALAATASFLIVALSAFRLAPTERGTGGFDLLANSDLPLHYDLAAAKGRRQLGFAEDDSKRLADATVIGFRVRDGEDASCLNLYQTSQPRVIGAPAELAQVSEFQWAAIAPVFSPAPSPSRGGLGRGEALPGDLPTRGAGTSPHQGEGSGGSHDGWRLLDAHLGNDANGRPIVPMVLDRNTAMYSLKLYRVGDQFSVRDAFDRPVTLQIVGMLTNSVLQGDVVISEANFLRLYPEVAGQRYFLIRRGQKSPPTDELGALLETQLEDFGFDAVDARVRLGELLAVQNTYLSTFQSLGALGLLLGAVGLAVVQLRSVLERRGELALMQAAGLRRGRLARMVLTENLVLLLGGLAIGTAAALAAVLPHAAVEQVGAPWRTLALLLAIVAITGTGAAWWAARSALRAPLIPALRGD